MKSSTTKSSVVCLVSFGAIFWYAYSLKSYLSQEKSISSNSCHNWLFKIMFLATSLTRKSQNEYTRTLWLAYLAWIN